MSWYPGCVLEQLDLVNIHKVRDSFDALQALCANACKTEMGYTEGLPGSGDDGRWQASLHESRWIGFVANILKVRSPLLSFPCFSFLGSSLAKGRDACRFLIARR